MLRALEQEWLPQRSHGETALVFLPGQGEIERCLRRIEACPWSEGVELTPLHGNLSLEAQQRAIAPARSPGGKVVLATSIAESSLTIAGVKLVIDSGLSRRSRFDPGSGMDALITLPASQASAARGAAGPDGWGPAAACDSGRRRNSSDAPASIPRSCWRWIPCRSPCSSRPGGRASGRSWRGSPPRRAGPAGGPPSPGISWAPSMPPGPSPPTAGPWPGWACIRGWPTCSCGRTPQASWIWPLIWPCC